jgi:hypothetical protein
MFDSPNLFPKFQGMRVQKNHDQQAPKNKLIYQIMVFSWYFSKLQSYNF